MWKERMKMKRFICISLTLMMVLAACTAAADETTFKTAYFTLTLPDGWEYDTEDLEKDAESQMEELGYFGASDEVGLVVSAYLIYYEDLKNLALWSSDENELQAYAEAVLEDFAEDHPTWLGTVLADRIPFILIQATDEDGEYLYADTITNGYAIVFMAYVIDSEENILPMTDAYIEQFKQVLTTFKPVS